MNNELIRRINEFNWQRVFSNTNISKEMDIINSIILNILSNFILDEFVVCVDKDPL